MRALWYHLFSVDAMLGSVDLASPLALPLTAQVASAPTLRCTTRDECDIHDMMSYSNIITKSAWDGVIIDFLASVFVLSSPLVHLFFLSSLIPAFHFSLVSFLASVFLSLSNTAGPGLFLIEYSISGRHACRAFQRKTVNTASRLRGQVHSVGFFCFLVLMSFYSWTDAPSLR